MRLMLIQNCVPQQAHNNVSKFATTNAEYAECHTKIKYKQVRPCSKCSSHASTFWKTKRTIWFSRPVHLSNTEEARRSLAVGPHPLLLLAQILLRWLHSTHFRSFPKHYLLQTVQSSGIWRRVVWHSLPNFGWTCCLPLRGIHVTYIASPEVLIASLKYEHKLKLNCIIATSAGCEFNVSLGSWTDCGSCRALSLVINFFSPSSALHQDQPSCS